jgi:hypothetical protein
MDRRYLGVEISEQYVEKAKKRLAELKKPRNSNLFLNQREMNELKQLSVDMGKDLKEIAGDKNLLEIFTNQFSVRMNTLPPHLSTRVGAAGRKQYSSHQIATAVKDLAD